MVREASDVVRDALEGAGEAAERLGGGIGPREEPLTRPARALVRDPARLAPRRAETARWTVAKCELPA